MSFYGNVYRMIVNGLEKILIRNAKDDRVYNVDPIPEKNEVFVNKEGDKVYFRGGNDWIHITAPNINLLGDTSKPEEGWGTQDGASFGGTTNDGRSCLYLYNSSSNFERKAFKSFSAPAAGNYTLSLSLKVASCNADDEVCYVFKIAKNNNGDPDDIITTVQILKSELQAGKWINISKTFSLNASGELYLIIEDFNRYIPTNDTKNVSYFFHLKLEEGSVATPWSTDSEQSFINISHGAPSAWSTNQVVAGYDVDKDEIVFNLSYDEAGHIAIANGTANKSIGLKGIKDSIDALQSGAPVRIEEDKGNDKDGLSIYKFYQGNTQIGVINIPRAFTGIEGSYNKDSNSIDFIFKTSETESKFSVPIGDLLEVLSGTDPDKGIKIEVENNIISATLKDDSVLTQHIAEGAVDTEQIAEGAVNESKIANGAVIENKIADKAVTNDKIDQEAVTNDKIARQTITADKISPEVKWNNIAEDSISENQIVDSAVTADKIANDAVTTDKIADGAITQNKLDENIVWKNLAGGSVGEDQILLNAVTESKIYDGAVTRDKIADGSISTDKIIDGSVTKEKLSQELNEHLKHCANNANEIDGLKIQINENDARIEEVLIEAKSYTDEEIMKIDGVKDSVFGITDDGNGLVSFVLYKYDTYNGEVEVEG